jgi:hypothetical protein
LGRFPYNETKRKVERDVHNAIYPLPTEERLEALKLVHEADCVQVEEERTRDMNQFKSLADENNPNEIRQYIDIISERASKRSVTDETVSLRINIRTLVTSVMS